MVYDLWLFIVFELDLWSISFPIGLSRTINCFSKKIVHPSFLSCPFLPSFHDLTHIQVASLQDYLFRNRIRLFPK